MPYVFLEVVTEFITLEHASYDLQNVRQLLDKSNILPVYMHICSASIFRRHKLGIQHKVEGGWDVGINWKLSEGITVPFIPVAYLEAHTVRRPGRMTSDAWMAITYYSTHKRKI
jgi:hypothetical protein